MAGAGTDVHGRPHDHQVVHLPRIQAGRLVTRAALIAALALATIAGLCALALHPALYPSDATDTGDLTC